METRYCKTHVLVAFWDKLLGQIHLRASELNDQKMIKLCGEIILIDKSVQYRALKSYVQACNKLYGIAFFQWRIKFAQFKKNKD